MVISVVLLVAHPLAGIGSREVRMLTWTREKGHELPEDDDEVAAPRFGRASQGSLQFKGTHGLQVTHNEFDVIEPLI